MQPKAYLADCENCPLKEQPFVAPTIPEGAIFTIVGEAPGREEVVKGQPFVGLSGQLLSKVLEQEGHDRTKIHITNTVLCWPKGNEKPSNEAVNCCNRRLLWEIQNIAKTKKVLAAGVVASNAVTIEGVDKITKERGKVVKGKGDFEVKITLHPAYILRNYTALPDLRQDVRTVLDENSVRETSYDILTTAEQTNELIDKLDHFLYGWKQRLYVSYDLETTSLVPQEAKILCLVISYEPGTAYVLVDEALNTKMLNRLFMVGHIWMGWNNIKYDNQVLLANGITPPVVCYDAMLAHYALDERRGHGLKRTAVSLLGVPDWEAELKSKLPKRRSKKDKEAVTAVREDSEGGFSSIPPDILNKYAARDADMTLQAGQKIRESLEEKPKQDELFKTILTPVAHMLSNVEYRGFRVDWELLNETILDYIGQKKTFVDIMRSIVKNDEFNPNSTQQLAKILFDDMGFEPIKATPKGAMSVSADVIELLQRQQPDNKFLAQYVDFKKIDKILGTYLLPFEQAAIKDSNGDYRLHPEFLVHGTTTGRLSGGVWLTWPRKDTNKFGAVLKYLVLPNRGHLLVAGDYSQLELRVLTCEAREPKYRDIFLRGEDPHAGTTDVLYGTEWRGLEDHKQWRTRGKTINFAVAYGAGPAKVADSAGVDFETAQQILRTFYGEFTEVTKFLNAVKQEMRDNGYVETFFGRRRYFELQIENSYEGVDNMWKIEKEACNFKIQSPANDLNFKAALEDEKWLVDSQILFMVHDSIEASVPEDKVEQRANQLKEIGERLPNQIYSDYVPFQVDVKWGTSWGNAEEQE